MKRLPLLTVALLLIGRCLCAAEVDVYFSPKGGCTDAAVKQIAAAHDTIRVQSYSFTSKPIADALITAKGRGVDVQVCCDERDNQGASFVGPQLQAAGIVVLMDGKHPIAHSKTITIDDYTVVTGSFNWSAQAESNLENMLVIKSKSLAKKYVENWKEHAAHCVPYKPKPQEKK